MFSSPAAAAPRRARAAVVAVLLVESVARGQEPDELASCAHEASLALQQGGATSAGPSITAFLREGERKNIPLSLPKKGCFGFLAIGRSRVQDLDLDVYTEAGISLVRDHALDARPYVRYCGAAGLGLVVSVRMSKGQGEFQLLRFQDAPAQLPDLNRTVGRCFAGSAGVRSRRPEIGPEPGGVSLAAAHQQIDRVFRERGYRFQRSLGRGILGTRARQRRAISLVGPACYAIVAVGGTSVRDLDLFVRASDGRELARDDRRAQHAVARFCTGETRNFLLDVRMFEGVGDYGVFAYALDGESAPGRPPGVDGLGRMRWRELERELQRRSLVPSLVTWGYASPGQTLFVPVSLQAGQCYAFAALPSEELRGGDLDLLLFEDDATIRAQDLGPGDPVVYHCPQRSGIFRIASRVFGVAGRFLVVRASDL